MGIRWPWMEQMDRRSLFLQRGTTGRKADVRLSLCFCFQTLDAISVLSNLMDMPACLS